MANILSVDAFLMRRLITICPKTTGQQLQVPIFQTQLPILYFIRPHSSRCHENRRDRFRHSVATTTTCSSYHTLSGLLCHTHTSTSSSVQNTTFLTLPSGVDSTSCRPTRSSCHKTLTLVPVRNASHQSQDSGPDQKVKVAKVILIRNPFNILRDRLYSWLIRVYFDPDFYLDDFAHGAKQAVLFVSEQLSEGAFENLDGLLSRKVLSEIQERYNKMSGQERKGLAISSDDLLSYPYDIRVHYDAEGVTKIIKVKIQLKCMWGYTPVPSSSRDKPGAYVEQNKNLHCDYEFHRDFSPGIDAEWTITGIRYSSFDQQETFQ